MVKTIYVKRWVQPYHKFVNENKVYVRGYYRKSKIYTPLKSKTLNNQGA